MDTIPDLINCNLFAIRQAARFVSQVYERHLGAVNMTSSQLTIFAVLYERPGITMAELAEIVVMDRTSLVRAIKPLSRDGYVLQKPDAGGSRKISLHLTDAGIQKYRDVIPHWNAAQKEYESLVGKTRSKLLRQELMAITQK